MYNLGSRLLCSSLDPSIPCLAEIHDSSPQASGGHQTDEQRLAEWSYEPAGFTGDHHASFELALKAASPDFGELSHLRDHVETTTGSTLTAPSKATSLLTASSGKLYEQHPVCGSAPCPLLSHAASSEDPMKNRTVGGHMGSERSSAKLAASIVVSRIMEICALQHVDSILCSFARQAPSTSMDISMQGTAAALWQPGISCAQQDPTHM